MGPLLLKVGLVVPVPRTALWEPGTKEAFTQPRPQRGQPLVLQLGGAPRR